MDKTEQKPTYEVNSVRTPPMMVPKPAPIGAPAENVAKAAARAAEGGNR